MDEYALRSHTRASEATNSGLFLNEILPIKAIQKNAETGEVKEVMVDKDDGIRHGTTLEALAGGRSAFPNWGLGLSTGGNSSQVTDGAAAAILMRRSVAEKMGVPILATHVGTAVSGVTPRYMGIGPAVVIPKMLEKAGLKAEDVNLWEVRSNTDRSITRGSQKTHCRSTKPSQQCTSTVWKSSAFLSRKSSESPRVKGVIG